MSHYDTLEVSPSASPEVVRAAYKSLMQRLHPDRNAGDQAIAARAAAVTHAYDVLSDPARRSAYDLSLRAGELARPMPRRTPPRKSPWASWWLLVPVVVAGAWMVAWQAGDRADPATELASMRRSFGSGGTTEARRRELYARKLALLERHPQLLAPAAAERAQDVAARTFVLLEAPLTVGVGNLELTLPKVSVVAGSFDAPSLLAHMGRHRERLVQELAARLAREDPERLARPDAESRVKEVVMEALASGLGTRPDEEYPSTWFESPGRYGVVGVLLPERYKLVQLNSLR